MYYIYILQLNNKTLYKGSTKNLINRIQDHNFGKVKSTKNMRPLKMIHYECYRLKSDALRREKFLKTTEGRNLLKKQIRDILSE